ncbi:MAG TPA: DUF2520 domain-containing protein [Terriglobales bacterium]|nr:DUF2520 domain-containing protein [Terriglobales bacterium]
MLAAVGRRSQAAGTKIAIVGSGNLGSALALSLRSAHYRITEIVSRDATQRRARQLARRLGARVTTLHHPEITADVIWFCVPDHAIASCAQAMAPHAAWKGKVAWHSSGALNSTELKALSRRGAWTASVHPFMTFVPGVTPALGGASFALEGNRKAVSMARQIVSDLGGRAFAISASNKAAYHTWGAFASPLLTALLALGEKVAAAAGVRRKQARRRMAPIVRQTVENYILRGAAAGFSGPIIRGDVATVRKHLAALRRIPGGEEVYRALARSALRTLPAKNRKALEKVLRSRGERLGQSALKES